ncbi:ATP-binding protein [Phaeocystidibacter luteus]|uniref:histidine kinase n=1 Tax=Phaeocystidibacter luteus TaxID=911197 RepID=A0A6N6RFJ6_9FLAO|nr:ATP-binding protein [Phaeocystidibacter luteus]KAB2809922.1 cyclic nucleotide-binding domain-containing protein [Phaeocystidibacter luteus]
MQTDLLTFLSDLEVFSEVPRESIEWMIGCGEVTTYQPGEFLFKKGEASQHMSIIIEGKFEVYQITDRGRKFFTEFEPGEITSQLPYSRLKEASGYGEAMEESCVFRLHKDCFREMISNHFELTRSLVHLMTSRVRNFTQMQVQNEKLMALGKLSAGLAHELNNPSSAMVRSAGELASQLRRAPESFKKLLKVQLKEEEVDGIQEILVSKLDAEPPKLSMMERNGKEEDVADWLEAHGEPNGFDYAEHLVEFGFSTADLEQMYQLTGQASLPPTLKWIDDQLRIVKMVGEIEEASKRIGSLVSSIKRYSYMDRDGDRQRVDIQDGLRSTVTMLAHKARKNKVKIEENMNGDAPTVLGLPGELNQVWTNIIDNALDAMEDNGGTLTISTESDDNYVRVRIKDSGPGIPDDVKTHIFEPFYTTKPQGKGTGLGLDIVKKILDQHHADIRVETQPGNTEFTIAFAK